MFLTFALLTFPQMIVPQDRPAAPYSLPPVSAQPREGASAPPSLVAPGAPPPVEQRAQLGDEVPLPVPAVTRADLGGDAIEQPASGHPHFLGFAAGRHHPPAGEVVDPALLVEAQTHRSDGRPGQETYAFVMFSKRMTPGRLDQLEAQGVRLLGFHPHHTQKVALPESAIAGVEALDFVHWIGLPQPWQKIHPRLTQELQGATPNQPVEVWVNVFESDVTAQSTRRSIPGPITSDLNGFESQGESLELMNVWTTNGWQQTALETAGLEIVDFNERINAFRARMMPQGLDLVTALDFVQFVELDPEASTSHDETMAMINADDARNFYDGGTNQQAIAGFVDGGMETDHQDLIQLSIGVDLSGSATNTPFDDDCGHGTHVAGTILGEGNVEAGHRGAAPGLGWGPTGMFLAVRIFSTCAGQPVDVGAVIGFLVVTHGGTPKAQVINNSWRTPGSSSAPWIGSEADARLYDDNAYVNAQLNVFAAGNEGSASGTIGLQPSAKNVLTVGNVLDYDDPFVGPPGSVWTDSSRGPCGDGRWKPNVVAPGQLVTSLDAFDNFGYALSSGTSMAAPHVTGVVADLIDKDISFAYLPERISAHMMATAHRVGNLIISTPSHPNLDASGAGRVDATKAMWSLGGSTWTSWAFSLGAGGVTNADFFVPTGATRLVAVMHYVEGAASAGASQALVNDWDLYLDQPPIDPSPNTGEYFAQQSSIDNTEIRVLNFPIAGTWRWKVYPSSTPGLAYFGMTIYVETLDTNPAIAPTFTVSEDYAQPFETVTVDYNLSTPGGSISAVDVGLSAGAGGIVTKAATYLQDGVETDLLDNVSGGWSVQLGNVDQLFSRSAQWQLDWSSEGSKQVAASTWQDTTSSYPFQTDTVIVDGTGPGSAPGLTSTSHTASVWSNDDTVDMAWSPATDPISGGVASGVDGYAVLMNPGFSWIPGFTPTEFGTTYTSVPQATGIHYFSMRTLDRAGNSSPITSFGPLRIDTIPPNQAFGVISTTHTIGVSSCDTTITTLWINGFDAHSGVWGYVVSADQIPDSEPAASTPSTQTASFASTVSGAGNWYVHVSTIDNAGNQAPAFHAGPYTIDPDPVAYYCVPKVNSQGCVPLMGSTGAPSASGPGITVVAGNVLNNKTGLLFWGTAPASNPFQGGTKCVANPTKRTPTQNSAGSPPPDDCSGTYAFTFDPSYMASKGIGVGDTIYSQYWYRDPSAPFNTGLTNALQFTVCP